MSVIGVSPSDFALLAKVIYQIYNDYKKGPQRLQGILDSLKDLAANAESLNSILEVANTKDCPKYGDFDRLKQDLNEAQLFLLKCLRSVESKNSMRRVIGATNLTISQSDLVGWQNKLADHRSRLESYKTSLIIRALYNNHRVDADLDEDDPQLDTLLRHLLSKLEQRRQSIGSPASFRTTPRMNTIDSTSSTLIAFSPDIKHRYQEITESAQALHLFERNQTPRNNPGGWSEFIERVAPLFPVRSTSAPSTDTLLGPSASSPASVNHGAEYDSPMQWGIPYLQYWGQSPNIAAELEGDVPTSPIQQIQTPALLNVTPNPLPPAPLILDDTRSVPCPRQNLRFVGKVEFSSEFTTKTYGQTWIEVDLEISQVEHTTYIWAIARVPLSSRKVTNLPVRGLRPLDVLGARNAPERRGICEPPAVFKHIIDNQSDSYPVVHHPGIESSPYSIEFNYGQLLEIEGISHCPELESKLNYRFTRKEDRDNMRANVFGKRLLVSAGYDNVRPAGVCDFQTLTLWEDTSAATNGWSDIYMTFPSNTKGKQSGPDGFLAFRVVGCARLEQAKKKRERLLLQLVPVTMSELCGQELQRQNSFLSNRTSSTGRSYLARRDSLPIETAGACEILLSESTEACKDDKKKLLRILKRRFEPG